MPTYAIGRRTLFNPERIYLTGDEYRLLVDSIRILKFGFIVEQRFDILMGNYVDLEKFMLTTTADYMANPNRGFSWFQSQRSRTIRLVSNLLNSALMYVDQTKHDLSTSFGKDSPQMVGFSAYARQLYDEHPEYRASVELRKHGQHRGFPVQGISLNSQLDQEEYQFSFSFHITVECQELAGDTKFKKSVLKELIEHGGKVEFVPIIRKFVECIAELHESLRKLTDADTDSSKAEVDRRIKQFEGEHPNVGSLLGLNIMTIDDDKSVVDFQYLPINSEDYRLELRKANSTLKNLSSRYVCGVKMR